MNAVSSETAFSRSQYRRAKILKIIGWVIGGIILALMLGLLFGFIVKWLWNWLMPAIFGLGGITYWQAFGVVVLAKLLLGGPGGHHDHNGDRFGSKFRDKWREHTGRGYDQGPPRPGGRNWKDYQQFWEQQGRAAFESFKSRSGPEDAGGSG